MLLKVQTAPLDIVTTQTNLLEMLSTVWVSIKKEGDNIENSTEILTIKTISDIEQKRNRLKLLEEEIYKVSKQTKMTTAEFRIGKVSDQCYSCQGMILNR